MSTLVLAALAWLYAMAIVQAQSPSATTVSVTADNFTRAETDTYFANIVKQAGSPGKFFHRREIEPIDNQIVIRGNRDTLYSAAVFDLDAGPVTEHRERNTEQRYVRYEYDPADPGPRRP